jgi:hypothetical protein
VRNSALGWEAPRVLAPLIGGLALPPDATRGHRRHYLELIFHQARRSETPQLTGLVAHTASCCCSLPQARGRGVRRGEASLITERPAALVS